MFFFSFNFFFIEYRTSCFYYFVHSADRCQSRSRGKREAGDDVSNDENSLAKDPLQQAHGKRQEKSGNFLDKNGTWTNRSMKSKTEN